MAVGTDDHSDLFDLLRIVRFHNINNVESSQRCITVLPANSRMLTLDLRRHGIGQFLEILGVSECVPGAVLEAFAKAYPNATIKGYSKETENGQVLYEIESEEGKTARDVTYSADGNVISVEETLDTSELPEGVKAALDTKFPGGKILKAEKVTKGAVVAYEFRIKHKGKKMEIVFDPEGNELRM